MENCTHRCWNLFAVSSSRGEYTTYICSMFLIFPMNLFPNLFSILNLPSVKLRCYRESRQTAVKAHRIFDNLLSYWPLNLKLFVKIGFKFIHPWWAGLSCATLRAKAGLKASRSLQNASSCLYGLGEGKGSVNRRKATFYSVSVSKPLSS